MPATSSPHRRIRGPRSAIHAVVGAALLVAPAGVRAQQGEEATVWQFGMREVDWEAVERLQEEIRDYREAGVIGPYELLIRTNGERLDAAVTAEIVDASKLAALRGLDRSDASVERPFSRERRDQDPPEALSGLYRLSASRSLDVRPAHP